MVVDGNERVPRRRVVSDRARAWGWQPQVNLEQALGELVEDLPHAVSGTSRS